MGYARYVGRVGALAVALGVGAAVATFPGVAWAEETGDDNASVDGAPANPEPATAPENEGNDGGGDPGDPSGATGTTTTTTTTGTQSTTVIGGGGSPQVTISGSTVELSGTTTEQTPESSAPTTAEVTPTVEPTTPPQPTYTPEPPTSPVPAPISSTVPDPPTTAPGDGEQELNAGQGDLQDVLDGQGDPSGTMKITAFDGGTDPGVGQYNLRMAGPAGVDDPQNFTAADYTAGFTTLDAPAPPPAAPDPLEAISVFIGSIISQVMNTVSAALAPIFGPGAPFYNAAIWGAIEAVRRQTNQAWANSTPVLDLQTTGQQDPDDREIHGTLGGFDPDGDALTYSVPTSGLGAPANGTVTIDATAGTWTYKPNTGYVGTDTFTITASDAAAGSHIHGAGQSHTGSDSITVTVAPAVTPNRAPVANDDDVTVAEGGTLNAIAVLGNDTDPDGNTTIKASTVKVVDGPYYGSATVNADGTIKYVSNGAEVLADSFTYTVEDTSGATSNAATVAVTISPVNDGGPVAVDDDGGSLREDTIGTVIAAYLAINDVDPDGDELTVTAVGNPQGGTVKLENGTITFTPTLNYTGPARFDYTVTDGLLSDVGTVSFTITPVNDGAPTANDDGPFEVAEGGTIEAITVLANDTDPDGNTTINASTVTILDEPDYGSATVNADGTIKYISNGAEVLADSFTYTVADTSGATSTPATVTIAITPVDDAPVIQSVTSSPTQTSSGAITYTVTVTDADTALADLDVTTTQPVDGSGTVSTPVFDSTTQTWMFTYTPDPQERLDAYSTAAVEQDLFTITAASTEQAQDHEQIAATVYPVRPVITDTATFPAAAGQIYAVVAGADGTAVRSTYTGDGSAANPYRTTVTVIHPDGTTTTKTVDGSPHGSAVVGADGTVYQRTYIGDGSAANPWQTTVRMIHPDGTMTTSDTIDGRPTGYLVVDTDGTMYQTLMEGNGSAANPHRTTVAVIHPDGTMTTSDTINGLMYDSVVVGADGTAAQMSYTFNPNATIPYRTTVTVIHPDRTITTTEVVDGWPSGKVVVDPDGTVYQTIYIGDGSAANPWQTTVRMIHPDGTMTTSDTIDGLAELHGVVVGADGTAYQRTYTRTGSAENPWQTTVTAIHPDGTTTPLGTIHGLASGNMAVVDDTAYQSIVTGNGSTANPYQTRIAVFHPDGTLTTSEVLEGYPTAVVVVDDTVYQSIVTGNGSAEDPYQSMIAVFHPDGTLTTTSEPVEGYPMALVVGADGTAAKTSYTYDGNAANPYRTTITVIHPDGTTTTKTIDGFAYGDAVVGADGTAYQASYTGNGSAENPYRTRITVIYPDGTATTTEAIDGQPSNPTVIDADGNVYQTTYRATPMSPGSYVTRVSLTPPPADEL